MARLPACPMSGRSAFNPVSKLLRYFSHAVISNADITVNDVFRAQGSLNISINPLKPELNFVVMNTHII